MNITNKYNLPQALVDLVADSQYKPKDNSISATQLLLNTGELVLMRKYYDELEQDVSDMMNMVIGTAVHSLIEKFDKTGFAEMFLKAEIYPGWFLTGKCDLYDTTTHTLVDYKTASVWKVQFADFEDWRKQGLIYAWLLFRQGYVVDKLKFHAILKDWTARDRRLKGGDYPESQVYTWEYKVTTFDLEEIERFIFTKFDKVIRGELQCEDTWYSGDKWAVYKKAGQARADRVCDSEQEARDYIANKLGGVGIVEYREGEHRKCQDYCLVCKYCGKGGK